MKLKWNFEGSDFLKKSNKLIVLVAFCFSETCFCFAWLFSFTQFKEV